MFAPDTLRIAPRMPICLPQRKFGCRNSASTFKNTACNWNCNPVYKRLSCREKWIPCWNWKLHRTHCTACTLKLDESSRVLSSKEFRRIPHEYGNWKRTVNSAFSCADALSNLPPLSTQTIPKRRNQKWFSFQFIFYVRKFENYSTGVTPESGVQTLQILEYWNTL